MITIKIEMILLATQLGVGVAGVISRMPYGKP
jgi:hypothetical protein